jgi:predicted permease
MGGFKHWFTRRKTLNDLSEEIQQYLEEKTDALVADGMSRKDAGIAARREFGNVTAIEESSRDVWRWPVIDALRGDTKFALRQLRKNRGFALTAILTLALGIGAATAIFSLVNAVLLRPLPFREQDRLMWMAARDHALPGVIPSSLSYPDYFDWRARNRTFSGIASYKSGTAVLESGGQPRHLDTMIVSANLFTVLGVTPAIGRNFQPDDEKPDNRAVMLSYALWQSAFGSAGDIATKTVKLGDHRFAVAGVMPRGFQFPLGAPAPALWLSLADDAGGKNPVTGQRTYQCLDIIGRLKTGVTPEQAKADLTLVAAGLARQYPDSNKRYSSALVESELQHSAGDSKPALRLLFGAVTLLLLIACSNVAGLTLARGSRRRAEFALRTSIGASRAVIIRQLLVESVALSLCGGVAGVALAYGLLRGIVPLMPLDIPRMESATVDGNALMFAVVVSVLTGLLSGVLPAWRMSELRPAQTMRDGSRTTTGGRNKRRVQSALVVTQTAIGLILLVSSGLLIRSFVRILRVDPGFDPKNVLTAKLEVSSGSLNHDQHLEFYNRLLARLSSVPGVQAASAGWPLPMTGSNATVSFSIEGRTVAKADEPDESIGIVMPGYFAALRIPLLSGRTFGEQDGIRALPVMVVNQAFAHKYFPGEAPLGKRIRAGLGDGVVKHPMREVVGVVGDIRRTGLTAAAKPEYYLPFSQAMIADLPLTIRTDGDPSALEASVRAAVHELDKTAPVYEVSKLEHYVATSLAQPRFQTLLLTGFAGLALLLAAVGLYGLLSCMVAERTQEIGVRMALGAKRTDVVRMIVHHGLMLTLVGLGAGLVSSAFITRLLSGLLYDIQPLDAATFTVMTGILLLVSLVASSIPARRAAQLDPIVALRES